MGDETLTAAAGICVTVPKALARLATAPVLPGSPLRVSSLAHPSFRSSETEFSMCVGSPGLRG